MKIFEIAEALDVAYASDKEFEEVKPTYDVQSNPCTRRSVEGRKLTILQINFSVLENRDVRALANIGEE